MPHGGIGFWHNCAGGLLLHLAVSSNIPLRCYAQPEVQLGRSTNIVRVLG